MTLGTSTSNGMCSHLLNHLVDFLLPREQNCSHEDALKEFVSDALIDSSDAFVPYNREYTIERGLILGMTGLEPTLHNTEGRGEKSHYRSPRTLLTYTGMSTRSQL